MTKHIVGILIYDAIMCICEYVKFYINILYIYIYILCFFFFFSVIIATVCHQGLLAGLDPWKCRQFAMGPWCEGINIVGYKRFSREKIATNMFPYKEFETNFTPPPKLTVCPRKWMFGSLLHFGKAQFSGARSVIGRVWDFWVRDCHWIYNFINQFGFSSWCEHSCLIQPD